MRILFMGTPEIAVASLSALLNDGQEIVGVVTSPDRPAGRGRKIKTSAIKDFAHEHRLKILQPEKLRSAEFLAKLSELNPDLIVVVAFRMLPEEVWKLPPLGTINLHASLLPHYRGAAPINRVLMNSETETGVSTFFIEKDIDTGKIIMQETIPIQPDENAGSLHDTIMEKGAELLVRTVRSIGKGDTPGIDQSELLKPGLQIKTAPKIFKQDCRIDWNRPVQAVYDHVRGLSPYPTAWTILRTPAGKEQILKIFASEKEETSAGHPPSTLLTDGKSGFGVACLGGLLRITELQVEGKKKMKTGEFIRGIQYLPLYSIK